MIRPMTLAASVSLGLALNVATVSCGLGSSLRGESVTAESVLGGALTVLAALAEADGGDGPLSIALDYLESGDLPQCCRMLSWYLGEVEDDPRVQAVLTLLQAELEAQG